MTQVPILTKTVTLLSLVISSQVLMQGGNGEVDLMLEEDPVIIDLEFWPVCHNYITTFKASSCIHVDKSLYSCDDMCMCEGVMLYLKVVVVFSDIYKKSWFFCLLGWGMYIFCSCLVSL